MYVILRMQYSFMVYTIKNVRTGMANVLEHLHFSDPLFVAFLRSVDYNHKLDGTPHLFVIHTYFS